MALTPNESALLAGLVDDYTKLKITWEELLARLLAVSPESAGVAAAVTAHNTSADAHAALFGTKIRAALTKDATFYVRPDGSDNNDGQADTAAGALKTINGALALLRRIDQRGYKATISLAPGKWSGVTIPGTTFNGLIRITSTDPAGLAFIALNVVDGARVDIDNIGIDLSLGYYGVNVANRSSLYINGPLTVRGTAAGPAIAASFFAYIRCNATSTPIHFDNVQSVSTIIWAVSFGYFDFLNAVLTGTATGARYRSQYMSVIDTKGKGPDYIPGNAAGYTTSGGLYL